MTGLHNATPADAPLLQAIFEAGPRPSMVWEVGADGTLRCLLANARAAELSAGPASGAAGRTVDEVLEPRRAQGLKAAFAELSATGKRVSYEEIFGDAGRPSWWLVELDAIAWDGGRPTRLLSSWTPIDFLKETELALHQSEASFQTLIEGAPDALFLSRDGVVTYVNPKAISLLDYARPADLLGRDLSEVVHPDDRETVRSWSGALVLGAPASAPTEVRLVRRDGEVVTVEFVALCLEHEAAACILGIARDVTERKEFQARMRIADRMVSLGTLAAGVAHEVNNPLAYVHGNLQWVLSRLSVARYEDKAEHDEIVQALGEALLGSERVRRIALDLKRLSRVDADEVGPVDVVRVIESVINVASSQIRWRARLSRAFSEVPPVLANDARLGQLFLNLLLNAAEAIAPGRVEDNEILVTVKEQGSAVVIAVRDTGGGIPPHLMSRLFDPFFTTKPAEVGTGLGLGICRSIVAGFGGELTVDSEVGRGSEFTVVLPAAAKPLNVRVPVEVAMPELRAEILVVDDEELVGNALRRMLTPSHRVTVVTSAREALACCRAARGPDVVICDVLMPQMTGLDFFAALSEVAPSLRSRVVFITGGALSADAAELLEKTSAPLLQKPIDYKLLDGVLRTLLSPADDVDAAVAG